MNEKKRLLKNTGIIALGNLSTKLVSFLLLPLYTSLLTTSEYGTVDYIISISIFCVPFISFLMDESMFRFLIDCKTENEKSEVISTVLLIIIFGGILFLFISIPILCALEYKYMLQLILYVISSVFTTMMCAFLRGIGRTDQYAVYNFLLSTAKILLNILFIAIFHWGINGMLLAAITSQFVLPMIYVVRMQLWKYVDVKKLKKKRIIDMMKYSIPLIPNKLSWSIINLSDRIIIMNLINGSASGLYAISHKFPTLMDTIYGFFYQSWKESSARVVGDSSQDTFYNIIYTYLKDFMYSIVLGMMAFMPLIFFILIDESYNEAILYVPFLLIATYFSNMSGFYGGIFTAYKDTKIMGTTTLCAAMINLVVHLVLIKEIGLYAAAISTLIANIIVYIYRKIKVRKYIVLKENRKKQGISIGITILIWTLYYTEEIPCLFLGCIISIIYAAVINSDILIILYKQVFKEKLKG